MSANAFESRRTDPVRIAGAVPSAVDLYDEDIPF